MAIPFLVRGYLVSNRLRRRLFAFQQACFNGVWLGLLSREQLHAVDELYYDGDRQLTTGYNRDYQSDQYNQRGLWEWEREAIERFFPASGRLLLVGAGGGREVVALQRLGYQVDGLECHPGLVAYANGLLSRLGLEASVRSAPRDACPSDPAAYSTTCYDGLIVGWGAYTLIRGRQRRVALLKQLRARAGAGCPVLVSFFTHRRHPRQLRLTARIGGLVSLLRGGERVELGDDLAMNFVHHFTEAEIRAELQEAGFRVVFYGTQGYGHAVGVAAPAEAGITDRGMPAPSPL